jgi:hypothetical protein
MGVLYIGKGGNGASSLTIPPARVPPLWLVLDLRKEQLSVDVVGLPNCINDPASWESLSLRASCTDI